MTATATREETRAEAKSAAKGKGGKAGKAPAKKPSFLKSKKGIIAIVAVLGLGYGGYTMFLAPPAKPGPPVGGVIVPLDATTVNLTGGHYLKVGIGIQLVEGKATAEDFKTSEAAELVIDEFSDRSVASLSSNTARKKLADELESKIKKAYEGEVFAIFVTQFVTQ